MPRASSRCGLEFVGDDRARIVEEPGDGDVGSLPLSRPPQGVAITPTRSLSAPVACSRADTMGIDAASR